MRTLMILVLAVGCGGNGTPPPNQPPPPTPNDPRTLRSPLEFEGIADPRARSQALFLEASKVFLHPRCANCHPADDTPRQRMGELHDPPVARGADDHGVPAMRCTGCHQDRNQDHTRVPGAPAWALAPIEMAWIGRTPAQICAQIKDPARNGGRSLAKIQEHVAHDKLVGWGWAPGADREPAPGTQELAGALVQAWIDTGAECPAEVAR